LETLIDSIPVYQSRSHGVAEKSARLEKEMGLRHLDHEWAIHQEGGAENTKYKRHESLC
jgi:hypothetical protein